LRQKARREHITRQPVRGPNLRHVAVSSGRLPTPAGFTNQVRRPPFAGAFGAPTGVAGCAPQSEARRATDRRASRGTACAVTSAGEASTATSTSSMSAQPKPSAAGPAGGAAGSSASPSSPSALRRRARRDRGAPPRDQGQLRHTPRVRGGPRQDPGCPRGPEPHAAHQGHGQVVPHWGVATHREGQPALHHLRKLRHAHPRARHAAPRCPPAAEAHAGGDQRALH